jgi:DNA-binding PucR family transcriptional regulator
LFEQRQGGELGAFIEATVGVLRAHDRRRSADLCGTLLSYLENAQNARATADALGVHVNTLRQRLESADTLLGSWREGGRALELHLALRLLELQRQVG